MSWAEIILCFATFGGPIAAIQVERMMAHFRDQKERKLAVFRTLMATRANTLAMDHVNALNAIPIEFYGHKPIIDAWRALYTHLHSDGWEAASWGQRKTDLLIMLLTAMGNDLDYKFNSSEIESIYSPKGHSVIEQDRLSILAGLAEVMNGKPIRMEVTNFPKQEMD